MNQNPQNPADEFESIVAGFDQSEMDEDLQKALQELDAKASPSEHNPLWKQPIAIIVTPLKDEKVLSAVIRLAAAAREDAGIKMPTPTKVVKTDKGALVAAQIDLEKAHTLAHITSVGLKGQPVVMLWHQGAMDISSFRYLSGEAVQSVSAGVIMASLDDMASAIITREILFSDLEGLDPMALSRQEAVSWIANASGRWFRRKRS